MNKSNHSSDRDKSQVEQRNGITELHTHSAAPSPWQHESNLKEHGELWLTGPVGCWEYLQCCSLANGCPASRPPTALVQSKTPLVVCARSRRSWLSAVWQVTAARKPRWSMTPEVGQENVEVWMTSKWWTNSLCFHITAFCSGTKLLTRLSKCVCVCVGGGAVIRQC